MLEDTKILHAVPSYDGCPSITLQRASSDVPAARKSLGQHDPEIHRPHGGEQSRALSSFPVFLRICQRCREGIKRAVRGLSCMRGLLTRQRQGLVVRQARVVMAPLSSDP